MHAPARRAGSVIPAPVLVPQEATSALPQHAILLCPCVRACLVTRTSHTSKKGPSLLGYGFAPAAAAKPAHLRPNQHSWAFNSCLRCNSCEGTNCFHTQHVLQLARCRARAAVPSPRCWPAVWAIISRDRLGSITRSGLAGPERCLCTWLGQGQPATLLLTKDICSTRHPSTHSLQLNARYASNSSEDGRCATIMRVGAGIYSSWALALKGRPAALPSR